MMGDNKVARKISHVVERTNLSGKDDVILSAVSKLVDFVKPTLGPKIRHILVDHGYKTELMDDGVSIAEEFELEDDFEEAVAMYVKQASKKSDDVAGDGTTSTMIILEALLRGMVESGKSYPEIKREMAKAKEEFDAALDEIKVDVKTEGDLYHVAKTAMDDEEAAKIVAEVIHKVGAKGAVTITDHTKKGMEYGVSYPAHLTQSCPKQYGGEDDVIKRRIVGLGRISKSPDILGEDNGNKT